MVKVAVHKKITLKAVWGITLMMIFGTGTMISAKFMLDTRSVGCDFGNTEPDRLFSKPLYQSWVMFFGMAVCLPVYWITKCLGFQKSSDVEVSALNDEERKRRRYTQIKNYFLIAIPATFDLLATTLMTFGLIYISVSIMQMLRGSMIIFSGLLTVFFRKVFFFFIFCFIFFYKINK
jgi:drug/metabolite transporter (DMT)-like permease